MATATMNSAMGLNATSFDPTSKGPREGTASQQQDAAAPAQLSRHELLPFT